jgi:putative ABC transport system permease protein
MFSSYLKIAMRSLFKNRLTSFINIFGLGLSMSVGLMILIRTQDAFSFDKFHPHPERTYRITSEYQEKNKEKWKMASTPLPLMNSLGSEATGIEAVASVYPALNGKANVNGKEIFIRGAFTEPSFFSIFGFTLTAGDASSALREPNSIVLSKETSEKYFGNSNAIGKTLQFENGPGFIVTGVLNTPPGKTHLNYDAFASYSTVPQMESSKYLETKSDNWFAFNAGYTYILLKEKVSASAMQSRLNALANNLNKANSEGVASFQLQPINKISPGNERYANDNAGGTSWMKIYIEGSVALLILLAACFNYTNLTIARALTRAKEVGIRKIAGAKRSQIFIQYIFESILLSVFALLFAGLILYFIIRYSPFNDGYEFIPSSFHYNTQFIIWAIVYALFAGTLAGTAPAWILSAFKPLRVFKNMATARLFGKLNLQKTLIVFQYSLSLVVIIFLFVFYRQFTFLGRLDPGFKKESMVFAQTKDINEELIKQKLATITGVKSVAGSSANFASRFNGLKTSAWVGEKRDIVALKYYYMDEDFVPTMHFALTAGRNLPALSPGEKEKYILVNEKAAQALGFSEPSKAIGQNLWVNDSTQMEIAGVLKDFRYENAGSPIDPLAFRFSREFSTNLYIETAGVDKAAIESHVKAVLSDLKAAQPESVTWLAEDLEKANSQAATISLLGFLAFIALAIASLGLLGLVVYTVEVKRKEISVRKVIGASEVQIMKILSRGFIRLLLISGLIAMPIGWILANMFIQVFSERTSFNLFHVLVCFLFLLGIGLFTILSQTYKAAIANPIKNLRME